MFSEGDEQDGDFEGFHMSNEKKSLTSLYMQKKKIISESINKLEEIDIKEVCTFNNEAPVFYSLIDCETAKMVLNQGDRDISDDEDDVVNTAKKCL